MSASRSLLLGGCILVLALPAVSGYGFMLRSLFSGVNRNIHIQETGAYLLTISAKPHDIQQELKVSVNRKYVASLYTENLATQLSMAMSFWSYDVIYLKAFEVKSGKRTMDIEVVVNLVPLRNTSHYTIRSHQLCRSMGQSSLLRLGNVLSATMTQPFSLRHVHMELKRGIYWITFYLAPLEKDNTKAALKYKKSINDQPFTAFVNFGYKGSTSFVSSAMEIKMDGYVYVDKVQGHQLVEQNTILSFIRLVDYEESTSHNTYRAFSGRPSHSYIPDFGQTLMNWDNKLIDSGQLYDRNTGQLHIPRNAIFIVSLRPATWEKAVLDLWLVETRNKESVAILNVFAAFGMKSGQEFILDASEKDFQLSVMRSPQQWVDLHSVSQDTLWSAAFLASATPGSPSVLLS